MDIVGGLILACTKYGNIRIGGEKAVPRFKMWNWIAMSICGAIGTGIIFWALGEPIFHYTNPPGAAGIKSFSEEAATWAVSQTMFHWSFEQFAFYSVPAIILGLILYNFKKPVSYDPVASLAVGRECKPLGNVFTWMIVFGMCAGVACSMGVGLMHIGAGIENISGLPQSKVEWAILAVIVTFIFVLSCVSGVEKGVKRMSSFTCYAFILLLIAILLLGPTRYILNMSAESFGTMLSELPKRTFITNAMYPKETWSSDWWLQYVGSFIVYGPVIGVFLAKIAYGRTIRQFILVNVLVSGGFCAIWCGVFGSMAVYLQSTGIFDVWAAVQEFGMQSTVYQLLSSLPGYIYAISVIAIWGSYYVTQKIIFIVFPTFTTMFIRYSIGGSILLWMLYKKRKQADYKAMKKQDLKWFLVAGAVGYFFCVIVQTASNRVCTASMSSLINAMAPITISLLATLFLKEKLTKEKIVALVTVVIGSIVIIGDVGLESSPLGIVGCFVSLLLWSLASVLFRKISFKYDPLSYTTFGILLSAFLLLPFVVWEYSTDQILFVNISLQVVAAAIYVATIGTVAGLLLWNKALAVLEASTCALFYPIQPIVSIVLGIVLLDEKITSSFLAGTVIISIGILYIVRKEVASV